MSSTPVHIWFRADASLEIGTGHVMRCLTLAGELRERGVRVGFLCREHPGHLGAAITERGFELRSLPAPTEWRPDAGDLAHASWLGVPWQQDAEETAAALREAGTARGTEADWLVVDHYALDARWERKLRPLARKLLAIDDLADRPHECDLLLDQNLYGDQETRYDGLVPEGCRRLLGPRYALLRPEFRAARAHLRPRDGRVRRIHIFFGGSDPSNQTAKALDAVRLLGRPEIAVDVMVGMVNPHRAQLERMAAGVPNARVHVGVRDWAHFLAEAELAIGAGGTSTWERCCLGLPTLVWPVAANQLALVEAAAGAGAILCPAADAVATPAALAAQLAALLGNPILLRTVAARARALCDGAGAPRVVRALLPPRVTLRRATEADMRRVFEWRNHPDVRRESKDSRPLDWPTHQAWFRAALKDSACVLLIAESECAPVGVLRYDLRGDEAEVSIYAVPGRAGQGYGAEMLREGERRLLGQGLSIGRFRAVVLAGNEPSHALFRGAGYLPAQTDYVKERKP